MPEYVLDTAGASEGWNTLSEEAQGFIEVLFFTSVEPTVDKSEWNTPENQDRLTEGQISNLPSDAGFADMDPEAVAEIVKFVDAWTAQNAALVAEVDALGDYSRNQLGADLLYTHAGHGVGFWDRKPLEANGLGERLTEAAGSGEVYAYWDGERITVDLY